MEDEDGVKLNADIKDASIKDKLKVESKPVKSLPNSESISKKTHPGLSAKLNGDCESILNNDQNSKPEKESKSKSDAADITNKDDDDFEPMTTRSLALISPLAASSEITIQRVTKDTEKLTRNYKVPKREITVSKPNSRSQSRENTKLNCTKTSQKIKSEDDKGIVEPSTRLGGRLTRKTNKRKETVALKSIKKDKKSEYDGLVETPVELKNENKIEEDILPPAEIIKSTVSEVEDNNKNETKSKDNLHRLIRMEVPPEKPINLIQDSQKNKEKKIDIPQNKNQEFDFTNKLEMPQSLFKLKLHPGLESDGERDACQKLSLIVDEQSSSATNGDAENQLKINQINENSMPETSCLVEPNQTLEHREHGNEISLAGKDVAAMTLALDDKIENVSIQNVVKECVRTSCHTCNYCRHASKIAVNGKVLALHLLSEHRYVPTKNETTDVINKLKQSLDDLSTMFFNSGTYDSTDPSLYVPYDNELLRFNCFQCNHDALSHKDLYAHKKKFHSKSLLLCIMCKSTFVSYSALICHVCPGKYSAETLNIYMKFRCCLCPIDSIPSGFRLMVHLRKSHHMCDTCLEIFRDQLKLSTHMRKHKLMHLCYRCGISYARKPDFTEHLFWKHGTESVLCKKCLQKKWPHVYHFCIPPTSFICEECNTSFSKAVALKVHKRIHGSDIRYLCTICDKKFVSKKLLLRHKDWHRKPVKKQDIGVKKDGVDEVNVTHIFGENQEPGDKKTEITEDNIKENKSAEKVKKMADLNIPPLNLSSESEESSDDEDGRPITEDLNNILPDSESLVKPDMTINTIQREQLLSDSNPLLENPTVDHNTANNTQNSTIDENQKINKDDKVDEIWVNFYKSNPQYWTLPYPLCAMKYEVAYSIIMADHNYFQKTEKPLMIKELLPPDCSDEKLEETSGIEKKVKSPKKKTRPSIDSSSCSSDTDSDSSREDSKAKTPKKRRSKTKTEHEKVISKSHQPPREPEVVETSKEEPEPVKAEDEQEHIVVEPEDSPIRESELETDETSSDEEFYDNEPQRKVIQIAVEKRHQLIQAAGLPNNGNLSPAIPVDSASPNLPYSFTSAQSPVLTLVAPSSESRLRSKRIRKSVPKVKVPIEKPAQSLYLNTPKSFILSSLSYPQYQDLKPQVHKSSFTPTDNLPSGSESNSSRSSKRRRIPNKFYGYSSEEEDNKTSMKGSKLDGSITKAFYNLPSGSEDNSSRSSKRRKIPHKFYGYSNKEEDNKTLMKSRKLDGSTTNAFYNLPSGSENNSSRSSKRRRIPTKFYGYSSEEEDNKTVMKSRKLDGSTTNAFSSSS